MTLFEGLVYTALLVIVLTLTLQGKQNKMDHDALLALLQLENAEVHEIGVKVQTLIDAVHAGGTSVPQDVQDAAAALKTSLDELSAQADADATPSA